MYTSREASFFLPIHRDTHAINSAVHLAVGNGQSLLGRHGSLGVALLAFLALGVGLDGRCGSAGLVGVVKVTLACNLISIWPSRGIE